MLRKILELKVGKLNDEQFKRVMKNTADDIRFNRISFKKMTYIEDFLEIAEQCFNMDKRIEKEFFKEIDFKIKERKCKMSKKDKSRKKGVRVEAEKTRRETELIVKRLRSYKNKKDLPSRNLGRSAN